MKLKGKLIAIWICLNIIILLTCPYDDFKFMFIHDKSFFRFMIVSFSTVIFFVNFMCYCLICLDATIDNYD